MEKEREIILLSLLTFFIIFYFHLSNAAIVSTGNFSGAGAIYSSIAVSNGYLYFGSNDYNVYQLNASNLSQSPIEYSASEKVRMTPIIFNNSIYVGDHSGYFYQLNASNVSQLIAKYTTFRVGSFDKMATPVIFNNSIYVGGFNILYQLNASNVSQQISNYTAGIDDSLTSPNITNGSIYIGGTKVVYQLNASNVSQQISNYTLPGIVGGELDSSLIIANVYIYLIDYFGFVYQLNASNVSQYITNYSTGSGNSYGSPTVANGSVYIGNNKCVFYQLNASNVSQYIANYTTNNSLVENCWTTAAVSGSYVYVGNENDTFYQFNASNVSQQIANYSTVGRIFSAPTISGDFVYVGDNSGRVYQFNASNINLLNIYCSESWGCTGWSSCSGGIQTRSCTDANSCGTILNRPILSQSCLEGDSFAQTSTTQTSIIDSITPEEPAIIQITNKYSSITSVRINAKNKMSNLTFTITPANVSYSDLQIIAGGKKGEFYGAYDINFTGNNADIANATIEFKVNKTWLNQTGFTTTNLALYRKQANSTIWRTLATTYIFQDIYYYYFSAVSPGFSTFLIFVSPDECIPAEKRCVENEVQFCLGNKKWLISEECDYKCENGKCIEKGLQVNLNPLIVYPVIGIIVVGVLISFFVQRIRNRSEEFSSRKIDDYFNRHSSYQ